MFLRTRSLSFPLVAALFFGVLAGCSPKPDVVMIKPRSANPADGMSVTYVSRGGSKKMRVEQSPEALLAEVNVKEDFIPAGRHARKYNRKMNPRYVTIHSTQNFSRGADAIRHSKALKNGKLRATKRKGGNRIGYLVWHYTTDENVAVQHLPCDEQGEHADFDGPGNNYSIGIEMCEHPGNSRTATVDRTAKLTAWLMYEHDIPLRNVVPHYHWARKGLSKPHKNCPHFLLDNGKPGQKWRWFQGRVKFYHDKITKKVPQYG